MFGPLTLVMKGENIWAKSAWVGSMVVPWVHKEKQSSEIFSSSLFREVALKVT